MRLTAVVKSGREGRAETSDGVTAGVLLRETSGSDGLSKESDIVGGEVESSRTVTGQGKERVVVPSCKRDQRR